MKLSARLEKLKRLMVPGGVLADVGCDHAWLSIAAARDGSFSRVLAADLRKAPLQAAARHIEEAGLTGTVIPLLSDGLSAVKGPVDVLVIAGMGGQLMTDILRGKRQDGSDTEEDRLRVRGLIRNARQLLLSPQSETVLVSRFLTEEL